MRGARPHQCGLVVAAVGQFDGGFGRALDDVEVSDDVAGVVPDEARASAARHGEDVARPDIAYQLCGSDVDHRGARFLEQFDGGFLVRRQIATRRHGAFCRLARTEPGLDGGQKLPQQHERGNAGGDEEPATDKVVLWRARVRVGVAHEKSPVEGNQRHSPLGRQRGGRSVTADSGKKWIS